jgi:hypothetical protein
LVEKYHKGQKAGIETLALEGVKYLKTDGVKYKII